MLKTIISKVIDKTLKKIKIYEFIFREKESKFAVGAIHELPFQEYHLQKLNLRTDQKEFYEKIQKNEFFIFDNFRNINEFKDIQQKDKPFWKCTWKHFDPKDYWEISRSTQWLQAYTYAQEIGKEQTVIEKLKEWINQTPYLKGLDWAVPLDVAIRGINFLLLYQQCKEQFLIEELWKHYVYLKRNLWISKNSIRNNHYLGELTAVAILSDFFNQTKAKKYKNQLEKEFQNQFYQDGVNEEQSIRYHKFALEFMIIAKVFLKINTPRLTNAIDFLRYTKKPDNTWPSIGDDDLGCVLKNSTDLYDYDYCLNFLENNQPLSPTKDFDKGGFLIHRSEKNNSQIIIKYGPHKWHAHADLFHIELTINGIPILIDSGTYRYNNVPKERNYFRSTKAHNTLEYNEKDQTEQWTKFRWKKGAKVINKEMKEKNDTITFSAEHTGYKKDGIIHKRTIEFDKELKEIKVIDKIKGNPTKDTKIYWHLDPRIEPTIIQENNNKKIRLTKSLPTVGGTTEEIRLTNSPPTEGGTTEGGGEGSRKTNDKIKTLGTIQIKGAKPKIKKTPYSKYYSHISENPTIIAEKANNTKTITTTFNFKAK